MRELSFFSILKNELFSITVMYKSDSYIYATVEKERNGQNLKKFPEKKFKIADGLKMYCRESDVPLYK